MNGDGSKPMNHQDLKGMNIHKSQLFWCSPEISRVPGFDENQHLSTQPGGLCLTIGSGEDCSSGGD